MELHYSRDVEIDVGGTAGSTTVQEYWDFEVEGGRFYCKVVNSSHSIHGRHRVAWSNVPDEILLAFEEKVETKKMETEEERKELVESYNTQIENMEKMQNKMKTSRGDN